MVKILFFLPILLLVAFVNISVDPQGLYDCQKDKSQQEEYGIAKTLASGQDIQIFKGLDENLLQKYFIEDLTAIPDILVLGSSQIMGLGDNVFPGQRIINNSITNAALPDYLGIFDGYVKRGWYPKRVIILLSPQLITLPLYHSKWLTVKEDVDDMLQRLGQRAGPIKPPVLSPVWLNVFSFSYFQESVKKLRDTQTKVPKGLCLLLHDGRCLWQKVSSMNSKDRDIKTPNYMKQAQMAWGLKTDQNLENTLEKFILYMKVHHEQVTFCLLPFHPKQYQWLLDSPWPKRMDIIKIENYYRKLGQRLGVKIVGSYDPALGGFTQDDFYDAMHLKNEVLEKIFVNN
ncbi:MAG: hypothetical protein HQL13_00290 [Candidatus Omnitrophica bacterium]|nr:hypothetical protein [Candidatus Omnitrophota bacterium]